MNYFCDTFKTETTHWCSCHDKHQLEKCPHASQAEINLAGARMQAKLPPWPKRPFWARIWNLLRA